MPRGSGTAQGGGRGQGAGMGRGGQGMGRGGGRGRMDGFGLGPGGNCICPNCGAAMSHQHGVPCYQMKCAQCGTPMMRQR